MGLATYYPEMITAGCFHRVLDLYQTGTGSTSGRRLQRHVPCGRDTLDTNRAEGTRTRNRSSNISSSQPPPLKLPQIVEEQHSPCPGPHPRPPRYGRSSMIGAPNGRGISGPTSPSRASECHWDRPLGGLRYWLARFDFICPLDLTRWLEPTLELRFPYLG
jgi:hypothetical protein